jgi:hypothetical protein
MSESVRIFVFLKGISSVMEISLFSQIGTRNCLGMAENAIR